MMENRSFLTGAGEEASRGKVENWQRAHIGGLKEEYPDRALEEILSLVNFELAKSLLAERAKKAGIPDSQLNFLGMDRIHFGAFGKGEYKVEANVLGLNRQAIEAAYKESAAKLGVLKILLHEETHAASFSGCKGFWPYENKEYWGEEAKKQPDLEKRSGLRYTSQSQVSVTTRKELFTGLNEGVVEKLSHEIFKEYLDRDQDFATREECKKFFEKLETGEVANEYPLEVKLVEMMVSRIAKEVGLGEDVVWNGFIHALFNGEKFEDSELEKLFVEIFDEDFFSSLKSSRIHEAVAEIEELNRGKLEKLIRLITKRLGLRKS